MKLQLLGRDADDPTRVAVLVHVDELETIDSIAHQNALLSGLMQLMSAPCRVSGDEFDGEMEKCALRVEIDSAFAPTLDQPIPRIVCRFELGVKNAAIGPAALAGELVPCGVERIVEKSDEGNGDGGELDLWGSFLAQLGAPDEDDDDAEGARGEGNDGRRGDGAGRPVRPGNGC